MSQLLLLLLKMPSTAWQGLLIRLAVLLAAAVEEGGIGIRFSCGLVVWTAIELL